MTRHGMVKTSVAGVTPPATDPHASVVIIAADRVVTNQVTGQKNHAYVQRSGLSVSIIPHTGCDRAIADMSRRLKSP
ncbi:hypothetical protein D9M68_332320 [compost metagenome]|nr:hypothetical protein N184_28425 [Sinorhizobium sp. GL28]